MEPTYSFAGQMYSQLRLPEMMLRCVRRAEESGGSGGNWQRDKRLAAAEKRRR